MTPTPLDKAASQSHAARGIALHRRGAGTHKMMTGAVRKHNATANARRGTGAFSASSAMATAAVAVLVATSSGLKSADSMLFIGPSTSLARVPGWGTRMSQEGAAENFDLQRMKRSRWCERSRVRRRQEQRVRRSPLLRMAASSDKGDVSTAL